MKSDSTIFFREFMQIIECYSQETDQLFFLKSILNYGLGEEIKTSQMPNKFRPAFIAVKSTIDKAKEKYNNICEVRSKAGKRGSEVRWGKIPKEKEELFLKIVQIWNSIPGLTQIKKLTDERKDKLMDLTERFKIEDFETVKENINKSDFLKGKNNQMWFATFDWLISENHFIKVLEGNYSNNGENAKEIDKIWNQNN